MDEKEKKQFHERRATGIGGSDAPVVLGESPWKTPQELWAEKTGLIDAPDISEKKDIKRGTVMEKIVIDEYENTIGNQVGLRQQFFRHPKADYMLGHIDGIRSDVDRGDVLVEVKVPRSWGFRKIATNGIPTYYLLQMQHYMEIASIEQGDFVAFNPDSWDLLIIPVKRDKDIGSLLMEKEGEFWDYVKTKTLPPEQPALDIPTDKFKPPTNTNILQLETLPDKEQLEWKDNLLTLKLLKERAEAVKEEIEAQKKVIINLMGNHSAVKGFGSAVYYLQQDGRKTFDVKKLQAAHPEIDVSEFYKQGKPFKTFRQFFLKGGTAYE